ncbi:MAG: FAD-dependent oxidoreductase, partial [Opitutales bacterium]|nr:FAD-dependent oxidoreductase [Opitutales bacterium]
SGKFPEAENRAITSIGMVPGRRDTFRVKGEYIFKEQDILGGWKDLKDAIGCGGWSMDDHPKEGFDAVNRPACRQIRKAHYYNIPFGSLISADFKNLMMAGRNISCSHVAFTSTRVMLTSATVGHAAGTAAAMSVLKNKTPREIRNTPKLLKELQQTLLRNNQAIVGVKNEDPKDFARSAKASANTSARGTSPENVLSGAAFDLKGETKNRWIAEMSKKPVLTLKWDKPKKISQIQITFDGGTRELTMTAHGDYLKSMIWGAQPEIVKDFKVVATTPQGKKVELANVSGNYRRLFRANFAPTEIAQLDVEILATNGDPLARICEIRTY